MEQLKQPTDINDMTDEEFARWSKEMEEIKSDVHGKLIEYRFDAYHDVKVYEDGYVEKFYIGD